MRLVRRLWFPLFPFNYLLATVYVLFSFLLITFVSPSILEGWRGYEGFDLLLWPLKIKCCSVSSAPNFESTLFYRRQNKWYPQMCQKKKNIMG